MPAEVPTTAADMAYSIIFRPHKSLVLTVMQRYDPTPSSDSKTKMSPPRSSAGHLFISEPRAVESGHAQRVRLNKRQEELGNTPLGHTLLVSSLLTAAPAYLPISFYDLAGAPMTHVCVPPSRSSIRPR